MKSTVLHNPVIAELVLTNCKQNNKNSNSSYFSKDKNSLKKNNRTSSNFAKSNKINNINDRANNIICVVEQPQDIYAFEKTNSSILDKLVL